MLIKRLLCFILAAVVTVTSCVTGAWFILSKKPEPIQQAAFDVPYPLLQRAMELDILSHNDPSAVELHWSELLACLAARYEGDFSKVPLSELTKLAHALSQGEPLTHFTASLPDYPYYLTVYQAVLDGMLGCTEESDKAEYPVNSRPHYGLKGYFPLAEDHPYSHYDDFGAPRTYGFDRPHLGHDLMCAEGTPVICIEEGIVEAMGWNEYGGWRIGIRSFDKKRYYYYAHLQQDHPYHQNLKPGMLVAAGTVIGYAGRTGYSKEENVNNIQSPHLHVGLELIFDENQKESDHEIWVDLYPLIQLLEHHRCRTVRSEQTGEQYTPNQS